MYDEDKTEESEESEEINKGQEEQGAQPSYTQPSYTQPSYTQPSYTQPSYAQSPYMQQPYMQQPYSGQPYVHAAAGDGYNSSPYSEYAKAQFGQQPDEIKTKKERILKERKTSLGFGRKNLAILIAVIIVACLASGIGGGLIVINMTQGGIPVTAPDNSNSNIQDNAVPPITIEPREDITIAEAVAKKVLSSVVGIEASGIIEGGFYGSGGQEFTGVGTGMILDTNGYILTNSHVVMDGVIDTIVVHLSHGEEVPGKLIWNDAALDLAIVKIESAGLVPVELGDSDNVTIGSLAIAIGNPLGLEFSGSVTQGVVSGLDRTITVASGLDGSPLTMQDLIQVDAAINSGNSGGPLLNSKGQVIGVNTAKARAEGMGFAIPINTAIPIVEKVLRDGNFERVFLGVSAASVEAIRNNFPNVEIVADQGAVITDMTPGSPAEKAGLKIKDVIIEVNGVGITGSDSLIKTLLGFVSGDTITVKFDRDGEILETEVTLMTQSELDLALQEENPFRNP